MKVTAESFELSYTRDVPEHLRRGLLDYVNDHQLPGGFLTAVLENDLKRAIAHADDDSLRGLKATVLWLWNLTPSGCWGSREAVSAWIAPGVRT